MMNTKKKRKKGGWKKILTGLGLILVLVLLIGTKITKKRDEKPLATTKITIGTVEEKLTETGNIELLRTVEVKSKIAGTVDKIMVKEGDPVVEGQVLAVIDPDPTQTLLLFQKRSSVTQNRINLEQATKELERKRDLARSALISRKELEDAENSFLLAQNNFSLAKQELEIMEREIETTGMGSEEKIVSSKVRAPYDGYITKRYVEEGTIVTSGISSVVAGTNLFQIGDPSTKIIRANISEVDIGRVEVGDDVRIMLDAYQDTSFAGKIKHISPVGELQQGRNVVSFKAEIEIVDKDPRLKPGMSCDVDVIIAKMDSVSYLPIESVYEKKEGAEEDGNETISRIVYVKNQDFNPEKKKFGLFGTESTAVDGFEERVVEVGIKSESRLHVIADIDTSVTLAQDAEAVYKELERLNKERENKNKGKSDD